MEQAMADLKVSAQKAWKAEEKLKKLLEQFVSNEK